MQMGNCIKAFEWYHFPWRSVTSDQGQGIIHCENNTEIQIGAYTRPTLGCHFSEIFTIWSIAQSFCYNWASCKKVFLNGLYNKSLSNAFFHALLLSRCGLWQKMVVTPLVTSSKVTWNSCSSQSNYVSRLKML